MPRNVTVSTVGDQDTIHLSFLPNKVICINISEFDTDIDVDDLTTIHHENIVGEILTISTLLNRIGILKAQAEKDLKDFALEHDILIAETRKRLRAKALGEGVRATYLEKHLADEIRIDQGIILSEKTLTRKQYEFAVIESIFWAVKSKDDKLNKMSDKLTPIEMESQIIEGVINQMLITSSDKLIK